MNAVVVIENIESQSSRQQFCDAEWQRSQMRCKGHNKPLQVIEKKMENHGDTSNLFDSYLFKLYMAVGGSWRCKAAEFWPAKGIGGRLFRSITWLEDFGKLWVSCWIFTVLIPPNGWLRKVEAEVYEYVWVSDSVDCGRHLRPQKRQLRLWHQMLVTREKHSSIVFYHNQIAIRLS